MAFAAQQQQQQQQQQQIRSGNSHQKQQQQKHHRNGSNKPTRALPQLHIIVVTVVSFLAGSIWSSLFHHVSCIPTSTSLLSAQSAFSLTDAALIEEEVKLRVSQELKRQGDAGGGAGNGRRRRRRNQDSLFPETTSRYAVAMARMNKKEFVQEIDMGVPLSASVEPGQEEVLLLYSSQSAMPANAFHDTSQMPLLSTPTALEQCDYLNIVLTDGTGMRKQCVAIVPQYESYHIQKWMRAPHDRHGNVNGPLQHKLPLTLVSRGYQGNGRQSFRPPRLEMDTRPHWSFLLTYFTIVDELLGVLRPMTKAIASEKNTIIVMVCNHGQSELLMNFVCTARQRNLTISNTIVFATDQATYELAKSMGLTAYYEERIFGSMPSEEAHAYGDKKFTAMMMAKVICVHLISMLGHNILFQDVDMVWYKEPLSFFEERHAKSYFDMYFQDDGGHSVRYAPLSANSGFYYIRHNDKTLYFMNALLMAGDLVTRSKSHQQAMIALLNEHTSLFGLRVKVLSRDEPEFPGGYQFHQKSGKYMRDFYNGKVEPYIFHMSWTLNKANKVLFLRQMGDWYLQDVCISKTVDDIIAQLPDAVSKDEPGALVAPCCALEPLITCHYRDKPSKIPCRDSPPIDKGKRSFW